jgi:hypothetical protein
MWASDIKTLNALHRDIIEIPSSSSYELSLFSSKAGSARGVGEGVALGGVSSSVSIGNLWPEIDSVEGVGHGGGTATTACDHLEALPLCH